MKTENIVCGFSSNEMKIYLNGEILCSYSYDKKQDKYICKHENEVYQKGYKFLYSTYPSGLCEQIIKSLTK